MATTLVSIEEYLRTSYQPDAQYVEGRIEERFFGEEDHAAWQMAIAGYFMRSGGAGTSECGLSCAPEQPIAAIASRILRSPMLQPRATLSLSCGR